MTSFGLPKISVILPVYDGEKYLAAAVQSILDQTFKNFELIIINDGSKDGSGQVAQSFMDPRIRYYEQPNSGLASALNIGLSLARAELIARQDQDDISLPRRLEKQIEFLSLHLEIVLLGTAAAILEGENPTSRFLRHPTGNRELQSFLCFDCPFVHSSVVFRKSAVQKLGGYRSEKSHQPEDYDLWLRLARGNKLANLPDVLLVYREVSSSMSRTGSDPFANVSVLAAERIRTIFFKVVSRNLLERFSRDLRVRAPLSRLRALVNCSILFGIGIRFGLNYPHLRERMKFCLQFVKHSKL